MAKDGEPCPGTGSTASTRSGQPSYVVSCPLPRARIAWLRQQSRHVAAAAQQRFGSDARGETFTAQIAPDVGGDMSQSSTENRLRLVRKLAAIQWAVAYTGTVSTVTLATMVFIAIRG